jgi:lycopene cyclase domain-containing protein
MTYWLVNALFLAAVASVALAAVALRRSPRWASVGIAAGVLLLFTAIFDNIMIGVGLVAYAPEHLSGLFVWLAPIEDFAYPIAAAVLLPSLWSLLYRPVEAKE